MKLAVSNIAWTAAQDEAAYEMLREEGVQHLEIAPTRFWPDLTQVTETEARACADRLAAEGLTICAFQALLFGKPELQLFGEDRGRALIDYMKGVCGIASWMGAKALVFGSPKNRLRGALPMEEAWERALDAFFELGEFATEHGTVICLEPNPPAYGADFLTDVEEAARLVEACNSDGIALNFDMGAIILQEANAKRMVRKFLPISGHFHVSEPMLEPFQEERIQHHDASAVLRGADYQGVISVEMKTPAGGLTIVRDSIRRIKQVYAV